MSIAALHQLRQRAELAEAQVHQLTEQLRTDELTGIGNRTALQHAFTGRAITAALMIDLNGFKPINDTHGHRAGDLVLIETAARLQRIVRPGELAARVSGDEFVLWIGAHDIDPYDLALAAHQRAHLARHVIADPIPLGRGTVQVTASVGVGVVEHPGCLEDVLAQADRDMYCHKPASRRLVEVPR